MREEMSGNGLDRREVAHFRKVHGRLEETVATRAEMGSNAKQAIVDEPRLRGRLEARCAATQMWLTR